MATPAVSTPSDSGAQVGASGRAPAGYVSTARRGDGRVHRHLLDLVGGSRIVNVGSGYAEGVDRSTVTCVDLDRRVLASDGTCVAADIAQLPFGSGVFDGALLKDVVEHVPDPLGALVEVRRVCRPGSTVVITVPRDVPRAVWADYTHVRGFSRGALLALVADAGLELGAGPARIGAVPGAGRLGLSVEAVRRICSVPLVGGYFGLNWIVQAVVAPGGVGTPISGSH